MKALIVLLFLLAGCAVTSPIPQSTSGAGTVAAPAPSLREVTHADLLAAAKYADDHGFPARAAVWRAFDTRLTAIEGQIDACKKAIEASLPKPLDPALQITPFLGIEMAAEAVGQFAGVPAAVKINCEPLPVITLPALPKF